MLNCFSIDKIDQVDLRVIDDNFKITLIVQDKNLMIVNTFYIQI